MEDDMTDELPDEQTQRNVTLQHIIDDLAARGLDRPVDELAERLVAALDEHGLPVMPPTWVRAVAESAASGNPYVVSPHTAKQPGFPTPETPAPGYGIP
jgi:hypothetical protein